MSVKDFYTVGEIAAESHAPLWRVRQVVDSLEPKVPRAGLYRLVPRDQIQSICERLQAMEAHK
jgi:hypothetical protein